MIILPSHVPCMQAKAEAAPLDFFGYILVWQGFDVFRPKKNTCRSKWMNVFCIPSSPFFTYLKNGAELLGGNLFMVGHFRRPVAFGRAINVIVGTFLIGEEKRWLQEQYLFWAKLVAQLFNFLGWGNYRLDEIFFSKEKNQPL